ncbi:hypothetical protein LCGC14_0630510 [marine sediment metagenome]|uniref:Uncharacterized protein n=1 Tax=marine sediment metagenome TaxID=412755 RepID=A0A0F9RLK7_9ZZZZ
MIVPAGKRRQQVNQGGTKHEIIMNSDLFEKIALGNLPGQMPEEITNQVDTGEVGDAMSQGGLGLRDPEQDRHPSDLGVAGKNPKSIAPNGTQRPSRGTKGGSPADQFLGPAPVNPQENVVDPYEQERQKIRQFVGYNNFGVDLKPGKNGLEVTLIPPPGTPVDVGGLLRALQKHLGGQWGGESTPAQVTGGPIKFSYTPEGMAEQNTQQTVEKKGPPLGSPLGKGQVTQSV